MNILKTILLAATCLALAAGCPGPSDTPSDATSTDAATDTGTDEGADAASDAGVDADAANMDGTGDGLGSDAAADTAGPPTPIDELDVGPNACCLSFTNTKAVWAELEYTEDPTCDVGDQCFGDGCKGFRTGPATYVCKRLTAGAVWLYDRTTGVTSRLDEGSTAVQKDPVISGNVVIWSDKRNGQDFDLWKHDLGTGVSAALVVGLGDQDEPTLDGDLLAWVGRNVPPHQAAEREIWTMYVSDLSSVRRLTTDEFEQTQPHCSGSRIVWADYGADPDGVYQPVADPASNNGDIVGYDLDKDELFTITTDASKQLRPAIQGDFVVWLDWRGINPEPKYSEFKVFGARVSPELVMSEEHWLAWSQWQRPSLWRRPTVKANGLAGWIQEGGTGELSAVFVAPIGPNPQPLQLIGAKDGFFEGVQLLDSQIGYVGAGRIGWLALEGIDVP